MRISENLQKAFGPSPSFETFLADFSVNAGLLPDLESLHSRRFLTRSVAPHILKLSQLFNRKDVDQADSLEPYWKQGHPKHLRLAYFLYFMPANLFRVASIWAELHRLGFRWEKNLPLKGIEFGAGPASGASGIAYGERFAPLGLPQMGNWALIEQDGATLELGKEWATHCFSHGFGGPQDPTSQVFPWEIRGFTRKIDATKGFLPPTAPRFSLWLMSFFLNEMQISMGDLAKQLLKDWNRHLENEGLVILVEPALKQQSRKLLALRKELLHEIEQSGGEYQLLLPCLGHQACGALANEEDWCHEEATWWRPPYFKILDEIVGLDRKTLPFSYLVFAKTKKSRQELLPQINGSVHRLVSPPHSEGRELEFFLCGQEGKRRARIKPELLKPEATPPLSRGDILQEAEIRGDVQASRIDRVKRRL